MKGPLTKKQRETLNYIISFDLKFGYMPSNFDLAKKFKISSGGSTHFRFDSLVKKGYITRLKNQSRGIIII